MVLRHNSSSAAAASSGGGAVNFAALGGVADGATNNAPILNAAIIAGAKTIIFDEPASGLSFDFSPTVGMPLANGVRLVAGNGRPTLRNVSVSNARLFSLSARTDVQLIGLKLDGNKGVTPTDALIVVGGGSTRFVIRDVEVVNSPSTSTGALVFSSASYCKVIDVLFTDPELGAVGINNSYGCEVDRLRVMNAGLGWPCGIIGASYRNTINAVYVDVAGFEGVVTQRECYENRISNCHIMGSGDNAMSLSGYRNVVENCTLVGNQRAGVGIWGQENVVTGCNIINNNTMDTTYWSGVWIDEGYGGTGSLNVIANNYFDDNQAVRTQMNSIRIHGSGSTYVNWAAGQSVTSGSDYRRNGAHVYVAASTGTTGATPPTHTSGTVTDGAVTWTYLRTYMGGYNRPAGNSFMGNISNRTKSGVHYHDANNWVGNSSLDAYV